MIIAEPQTGFEPTEYQLHRVVSEGADSTAWIKAVGDLWRAEASVGPSDRLRRSGHGRMGWKVSQIQPSDLGAAMDWARDAMETLSTAWTAAVSAEELVASLGVVEAK